MSKLNYTLYMSCYAIKKLSDRKINIYGNNFTELLYKRILQSFCSKNIESKRKKKYIQTLN